MWPTVAPQPFIGLGCMRLSTAHGRDDARAVAVLHAAFDSGIAFLDTADAYCWDEHDVGHNERLIAHALSTWNGDRSRIIVATKGGLTRSEGRWTPDGRVRHLIEACQASRRALGVDRISLYQLHAPDPRTPFSTSLRALASLKEDGAIEHVGLCNVTVSRIEEAREIVEIASVQVEINPWNADNILSGVAEYCAAHDIRLIAHRPLGGVKGAGRALKDPVLLDLAARHGASAHEIALAWLRDLSPAILPIPGATRIETIQSIARAAAIQLTDDDRERLDERFAPAAVLRQTRTTATRKPDVTRDGEVVLIMGLPGAGKSTLAQTFVAQGYARLNRDQSGGSLRALGAELGRVVESGHTRVVLDNTYVSRKSRAVLLQAAGKAGLPVRCVWLSTGIEDAQVNAAWRIWSNYGRLLEPEEMRDAAKRDVSAFGPTVQFRYQRDLEPPDVAEGFARVDVIPFQRHPHDGFSNKALIVWCDGVLVRSRSGERSPATADDVEIVDDARADKLRRQAESGWRLLGLSWRPEVEDDIARAQNAEAVFARVQEILGVPIDIQFCPHGGGPPVCWCRKPLPGLAVAFVRRYQLDPAACTYVGGGAPDAALARRMGFQYMEAESFFEN